MSESRVHIDLVKLAYEYICTLVPVDRTGLIKYDSADTEKPPKVFGNYIPDVYYISEEQLIIGEAKTSGDFDKEHSFCQYDSYLHDCGAFPGQSWLVISVPWSLSLTAKNFFQRKKRQMNLKTHIIIINELGRFGEI